MQGPFTLYTRLQFIDPLLERARRDEWPMKRLIHEAIDAAEIYYELRRFEVKCPKFCGIIIAILQAEYSPPS